MLTPLIRIIAASTVIATTGCAAPSHLMHYQRTVVGFDASVATQQTSGQIVFGYDRRMVAVVPKTIAEGGKKNAMSIISCTDAEAGFTTVRFEERLATGDAAKKYAAALKAKPQASSFNCINQ